MLARIARNARITGIGSLAMIVGIGGLFALGACGGEEPIVVPTKPLNLSGTWSGQVGQPGSMSALRLTWVATHRGDEVSGLATLVKPAVGVQARGVLTGTLSGSRLTLRFVVLAGSVEGFTRCEIAEHGDASATVDEITGSIALVVISCADTGLETPASSDLRLVR